MRRAPFAFYLAGLFAALFGLAMLVALIAADTDTGDVWGTLWLRVGAAVLAALSGVAVEALWCARRWAYPATLTLALAYAAAVLTCTMVTAGVLEGLFVSLILLVLSAMVIFPIVFFVRDISIDRFGVPYRRQAPPPPVVRPAPPNAGRQPAPWW